MSFAILAAALLIILLGAEAFTNALEHLGERFQISEGVTGSIFAAVGTALPEAIVPIVALLGPGGGEQLREEVSVGAILGAPLMLSTLTLLLLAIFSAGRRGWHGELKPERTGLKRDLGWFLATFGLAGITIFVPFQYSLARTVIGFVLAVCYVLYLILTMRACASLVESGHGTETDRPLFLSHIGLRPGPPAIVLQLALGLILIIAGAKTFIFGIEELTAFLRLSALAVSLLVIPIATELPEKVNSILWIRRGRDTLAFSNITGAMVFQGSVLPVLGILLTPWSPRPEVVLGMGLTLIASLYVFVLVSCGGALRPYHLLINGACYITYFAALLGKG